MIKFLKKTVFRLFNAPPIDTSLTPRDIEIRERLKDNRRNRQAVFDAANLHTSIPKEPVSLATSYAVNHRRIIAQSNKHGTYNNEI